MSNDGTGPTESPENPASGTAAGQLQDADISKIREVVLRAAAPAFTGVTTLVLVFEFLVNAVEPPLRYWVIGVAIVLVFSAWVWDLSHRGGRRPASILAANIGVGVICLVLGSVLHPVIDKAYDQWLVNCDDPVELTVMVPVDGASGFQEAIGEFNRQYVDRNRCKLANVTAYAASWPDVERALRLGWQTPEDPEEQTGEFQPLREVGPRPDFWIAESLTQVHLAEDLLDESPIEENVLVPSDADRLGTTPLVVAVPQEVYETGFSDEHQTIEEPLPDLIERLESEYGLPVLRSDPAVSYTGLLHLRALYGEDPSAASIGARIENQLARSVEEAGIALPGSDTDLLCDVSLTQGSSPQVAVLTTERALSRYNSGQPLGAKCPLREDSRSGFAPLYSTGLGSLDYQTIGFKWTDDPWSERRSEVAAKLHDWLSGKDDLRPGRIGVRHAQYDGEDLEASSEFLTGLTVPADPLGIEDHAALQETYSANRVPTDVLLAIDHSLTMDERGGEGSSRFELASEGVLAALGYLGPDDQAGLWTFPAEGAASHTELLAIAPRTGEQAADLLAASEPSQGVDLHQTIVEGAEALDAAVDEDRIQAMVVLTDGADPDTSSTTVEQVRERLADSGVSLYVIAVGEASCRSGHFTELTAEPRITCLEAEEHRITATLDSLFSQLWG